MKKIPSSYYLYGAAAIVVVGLFAAIIANAVKSSVPSVYDGFAQCLTEKGVKMYGAWWCPHCQNQKDLFGSAFDYVDYVECSPGSSKVMAAQCKDAGIEGYPTWVFADGSKASGEQSFEQLSEKSSCPLPGADETAE